MTPTPLISSALWDALYSWVNGVLPSVEVIQSHEDAPSPKGNFICIDYAGTWTLRGSSASRMISDKPDLVSPRVYTYTGTIQIRDVDGDGENLLLLLESLENFEVQNDFENKGFSILNSSGPMVMPTLQQTQWRRESILTLTLAWSRAYSGNTPAIESVEVKQISSNSGENNLILISNEEAANGT